MLTQDPPIGSPSQSQAERCSYKQCGQLPVPLSWAEATREDAKVLGDPKGSSYGPTMHTLVCRLPLPPSEA